MSYVGGTTELISRKGYGGLGDLKPLPSLAEIQAKAKEEAKAKKQPTLMEKFWKGFTTITSPPAKPGGDVVQVVSPSWVMPAAIGGGVLVLVLLLRKK